MPDILRDDVEVIFKEWQLIGEQMEIECMNKRVREEYGTL